MLFALPLALAAQATFAPPVRIEAADGPIDVVVGHAAPLLFDFDEDGRRDLLVGEFGGGSFPGERLPEHLREGGHYSEGKLRIYRNIGTASKPAYAGFEYLQADGGHASIPST